MAKRKCGEEEERLVKKGEAARFFGFSHTAGYRYIDYLVHEGILSPRFLPGVRSPRFFMHDLQTIATTSGPEVSRKFDVNLKAKKI